MKLSTKGKILTITLGSECSIIDVEEHTDSIRVLPDNIKQIHLKTNDIVEIDTAYLQCIYALKKEAEEKNIAMQIIGKSKVFEHTCRLYGLETIASLSSTKEKKLKK
ncbi:MAG: hypothetical protein HQK65_04300 [Desulfamplus sp.]|nr:hypothetical protein [Desulfamplus sp.]